MNNIRIQPSRNLFSNRKSRIRGWVDNLASRRKYSLSINLEVRLVVQTQEEVEGLVPAEACLDDRE